MTRILIIALMALFALPGTVALAATGAEITAVIDESKTLRQNIPPGFEWRFTGERLKKAEELLAAGKLDEAEAMAFRVRREIQLAIEQAQTAEIVWQITVPK